MISKEISLNLSNGNKITLKNKSNINDLKCEDEKAVFNIFDSNHDGILSKDEFANVKYFSAGIFSVTENKNHTRIDYVEDVDNNNTPEYTSRWILNKEGRILDKINDINGDGKTDNHIAQTYSEDNEQTGYLEEDFEEGELVYSYAEVKKNGEMLTRTLGYKNGKKVLNYEIPNCWSINKVQNAFKELDGQSEIE